MSFKFSDLVVLLFLMTPLFLLSMKTVVELHQDLSPLNSLIYAASISILIFGTYISSKSKKLEFGSFVLIGIGIFATFLAFFTLKDVASLALVALVIIPVFFLILLKKFAGAAH